MRRFVILIVSIMLMSCGYNDWDLEDPRVAASSERWQKYLSEYPAGSNIDALKLYLKKNDIDFSENEDYLYAQLDRIKVGVWYKKCNAFTIHLTAVVGPNGLMEGYELRSAAPCF